VFVITVIRYSYTVKIDVVTCHLGPKIWQYFVCNKREFVITVIVITEFDCVYQLSELGLRKHYLTKK
jgi:hypothetical protein